MKKLTPAALALLKALSAGGGNYATHPSTRAALIERGWTAKDSAGRFYVITDAGREALKQIGSLT